MESEKLLAFAGWAFVFLCAGAVIFGFPLFVIRVVRATSKERASERGVTQSDPQFNSIAKLEQRSLWRLIGSMILAGIVTAGASIFAAEMIGLKVRGRGVGVLLVFIWFALTASFNRFFSRLRKRGDA